ncbi:hypothetical protein C8F01DRAFT_1150361 [Mycena amicta]|nr:hypothetical protein C8F01DRAFT_1150361 [Mycena amicta]
MGNAGEGRYELSVPPLSSSMPLLFRLVLLQPAESHPVPAGTSFPGPKYRRLAQSMDLAPAKTNGRPERKEQECAFAHLPRRFHFARSYPDVELLRKSWMQACIALPRTQLQAPPLWVWSTRASHLHAMPFSES